jgi:hypothetical protein
MPVRRPERVAMVILGLDDPDAGGAHLGQVRAVAVMAQRREVAAVFDPDQDISVGAGDRRDQGGSGEVTVGQHHHACSHAAQKAGGIGVSPLAVGSNTA